MQVAVHLSHEELAVMVIALGSMTVTDHKEEYALLKTRLTKTLKRKRRDLYDALVERGDAEPV